MYIPQMEIMWVKTEKYQIDNVLPPAFHFKDHLKYSNINQNGLLIHDKTLNK